MLGSPENKPSFLTDKALQPAIEKVLLKKFPLYDSKASQLSAVNGMKADIIKSLSLYYHTFVDILTLKDHIVDLLTTIDACQVQMDITLNFDLTKTYLELIVTYMSIMILMSKVDDRKTVLALYNSAHEFMHGKSDPAYHRLGQMCLEYDPPMKKMAEEFVPHSRHLMPALMSLHKVYPTRNLTAEMMRNLQILSILSEPAKMSTVPSTDMIQCEYLSLDTMERWIIFGLMLCYQNLSEPQAWDLWKQALQDSYIITLCRNEVLHTHSYIIAFFDSLRGQNKRVAELKEFQVQALQTAPALHRERRKFLRSTLRDLTLVFTEEPGLLGPKALFVFQGLSLARDEILWLLRHVVNPPSKRHNVKMSPEDFYDRQLPELLFYMEELRGLVKKYNEVIQRYYVQYLSGYDAIFLNQLIQNISMCPEDESIILSSFYNSIAALSVRQVEKNELFDFRGFRLDWFRLQAYTSVSKAGLELKNHQELAKHMNTVVFHTKMVDYLDEMINETGDLSIYCFYTTLFEHQFKQCMEFLAQHRYSIIFPMICGHFMNATHSLCPEERHSIGTTSVQYAHWFLREMSEEVNQVITSICEEQCMLNYKRISVGRTSIKYAHWFLTEMSHEVCQVVIDFCDENAKLDSKLLPKHSAAIILSQRQKSKEKKEKKIQEPEKPGDESIRKNRENFTRMDKLHMALTDLCYAINYCTVINVWDHGFVPREFFLQHLETRFNKALVGMMMYNPEVNEIAKPSELLNGVRAYMNVLQSIENYVHIDIVRVFNNVLSMQTQPSDANGEKTITHIYTHWYLEILLMRVACNAGQIVFSPSRKAFVTVAQGDGPPLAAEEYADLTELRALAELIGPYGMKYLGERLMLNIASQVDEIKKLVVANKDTLVQLRSSFDKPDVMSALTRKLMTPYKNAPCDADVLLIRMTKIGILLAFRSLAQEALNDILDQRIPFMMGSIRDVQHHVPNTKDSMRLKSQMVVNELASSAGEKCSVDPTLCNALRTLKSAYADDEYTIACLLFVFVAVSIPKLARLDSSSFKASIEGHLNNSHCLAKSINGLAGALFSLYGPGDTDLRLQEFLALASSSLLRLGFENDREAVKNRESIYLLLDQIVQESPFLTMDLLEFCFPYALLRNAYHSVYKASAADM
ncbi:membrane-associated protein Hem-like isoform X3 [Biomphalaria pfeifferi]|uniref:Membrane-associated protein Hem-like isoform X3 n=1 Tax=Biomphalaria pfeifferi TaxID=112525 RepID=A0AAD8C9Z4_BIOPF|nr:membrane-associated protein Hem-like isoform X3 [Biomphalaria pfeifferi]